MMAAGVGAMSGVCAWANAAGKEQHATKQKGTGAKGSGQMVTDEEMADEEMACRRRGKSKYDPLSAFMAYEDTCITALSELEDAVYKTIKMPARAKSPTF